MASLSFYNLAISFFSLFMLNYLDFALRAVVLKYFFELASYFYMSFI